MVEMEKRLGRKLEDDYREHYIKKKWGQTNDLAELFVKNGLARIYGTRTDGRDSRTYLARLRSLEQQAKSAGLGGWRH